MLSALRVALRFLPPLIILIGVSGYAYWALNSDGLVREGNWVGVDFHVYYQAALALRRGEDIYSAAISPSYVYPPLLAALVVPLSFLNVTTATILWKVAQHLCLVAAGALLTNLVPTRVRLLLVGVLCMALLTAPVQNEIRVGESNSVVLLLLVWAVWLVAWSQAGGKRHAPYIAGGLLLGLAVSIKVLPVLVVIYFALRGPRRVAAWAMGSFLALQIVTLALTPATLRYWLEVFPGLFGQAFPFPDNQSINAFFSRAFLPSDPNLPPMQIAQGEAVRGIVTWLANLMVLAACAFVLSGPDRREEGLNREQGNVKLLLEVGLVLLTTHLVSGSTWLHHLVGLSVPVAGLIGMWGLGRNNAGPKRAGLWIVVAGMAYVLLLRGPYEWLYSASELAPGNAAVALVASSIPMCVVMGLWLAVAWRVAFSDSNELCDP